MKCENCKQPIPPEDLSFIVADKKGGHCRFCRQLLYWLRKTTTRFEVATMEYKNDVTREESGYFYMASGEDIDYHGLDDAWYKCKECDKDDIGDEEELIKHVVEEHHDNVASIVIHLQRKKTRSYFDKRPVCGESSRDKFSNFVSNKKWLCNCKKCLKEVEKDGDD